MYLHTFHKNEIKVFECEYYYKLSNTHNSSLICVKIKPDDYRRLVHKDEGMVYNDQLWLSEKDYQKAVDLFIESRQDKIANLNLEMNKYSDQIKTLYELIGPEKRNKKED